MQMIGNPKVLIRTVGEIKLNTSNTRPVCKIKNVHLKQFIFVGGKVAPSFAGGSPKRWTSGALFNPEKYFNFRK